MDRGVWWGYSPWVTESQTQLKRLRLFHSRQDRGLTQDWGGVEDGMRAPGGDISKARSADVWESGRTGDRGVVQALTEWTLRNCSTSWGRSIECDGRAGFRGNWPGEPWAALHFIHALP